MKKLKLLMVSNLFPPDYLGGYELNAWKIAHALRRRGHDVDVVTSGYRDEYTGVREDPEWVHRILNFMSAPPRFKGDGKGGKFKSFGTFYRHEANGIRNLQRLDAFLPSREYDLAYVFGLHDVGFCCARLIEEKQLPLLWHFGDVQAARLGDVYRRGRIHTLVGDTLLRAAKLREEQISYRYCAFVSQATLDLFRQQGVSPENAYVIPRGIEVPLVERASGQLSNPPMFLLAGQLVEKKGIHIALEAGRLLAGRRPNLMWEMKIAGVCKGEYFEGLQQTVGGDSALSARVSFLGGLDRPQTLSLMVGACAFISASIQFEPFANTIIESMAMGAPLIASEEGSIFEVVTNEVSALTYPKLCASELSVRMERILTDPELASSLSRAGTARIREAYTMDAIMDRTESVMAEVLELSRGGKRAA